MMARCLLARSLRVLLPTASLMLACSGDPQGPGADEVGESESEGESSGSESSGSGETSDDGSTDTSESDESSTDTGDIDESEASETGPDEPDPRLGALLTYAPRVWLDDEEEYFPSSVELVYPHMVRFADGEGNHWIRTIEALESPSDELPFFQGDLADAPVYAYYAEKSPEIVDLVYFFWYPYNRGKSVLDTIWGNHVGDWEHITVRLLREGDALVPSQVYLSAHSFGGAYGWDEIQRFEDTHPIVYSAWGSHGMWKDPGDHVYMTIGVTDPIFDTCISLICTDLVDETSEGTAWDTWERLEGFDFMAQEGLGGSEWPVWMSDQFTDPGAGDPTIPGMGPIYRWGNPEDCSTLGVDISDLIGVCRLEDGPTGPVSKGVWGMELQ